MLTEFVFFMFLTIKMSLVKLFLYLFENVSFLFTTCTRSPILNLLQFFVVHI